LLALARPRARPDDGGRPTATGKEGFAVLDKGFKQLLAEANGVIETISVQDAKGMLGRDDVVFVDVRESGERANGFVPGSVHVPRGFLEFMADPESPMHNPALAPGKRLVLYCGSGGRSALATKTLRDMGFKDACHIAGGFGAWVESGAPTE